MESELRSDVLGPIGKDSDGGPDPNEELKLEGGIPQNFYITGYLEPRSWTSQEELVDGFDDVKVSTQKDEDELEDGGSAREISGEEGEPISEEIVSGDTLQAPSSMGVSVVLSSPSDGLTVEANWGSYSPSDDDPDLWLRKPHSKSWVLSASILDEIEEKQFREFDSDEDGVVINVRVQDLDSRRHVTCRLVNRKQLSEGSKQRERGESTIFQCSLALGSEGFSDARWQSDLETDPTTAILYHDSRVYSRGHNVSVDWSEDGTKVWSEWLPRYDIRKMENNPKLDACIPPMEDLIEPARFENGLSTLRGLAEEYENWADSIEAWFEENGQSKLKDSLHPKFDSNVKSVRSTIDRMRQGLDLLADSPRAASAFQKANDSILRSSSCKGGGIPEFKWRPFQISFILLNISGLLWDEESSEEEDRSIVDLAWFPTGGGKTEAYLGLIAALGFYRLERGDDQVPSVHAIMRYTLRLLTLNQGERAARLMVGMNAVAREHGIEGDPFRVGMWIGGTATPNKLRDAQQILNQMKETGAPPKTGCTPLQLEDCPWCTTSISNPDHWNIVNGRLIGKCPNEECELHERPIPFSCVDEELYTNPPTLLIGTIDKFARLGSVAESRVLIGLKTGDIHRRPPDLVIQDELHLLTGPLGSLSGLFETAIETLWARAGHTAKYVAATATIRGAERDSRLMYGRELNIFPPPGSTVRDNFFATESSKKPGRRHVAIVGNIGHSNTLLERPFASVLQRASDIRADSGDEPIDGYWTPICYFNSLRELSGAQSSVEDSISQQWIPEFAGRSGSPPREVDETAELYSRKKAHELKSTMARLNRGIGDVDCLDLCLTTNMFQVGIDVDRLGLMLINGQPKSNSEYIQASGRVGRGDAPGLVVSLLRSTKPRDLSHYEMHRSFHQEMYRHVDITTTTPFSARAFDRAAASVIMLLMRQGFEGLRENDGIRQLAWPEAQRKADSIISEFESAVLERVSDDEQKRQVTQKIRGQWMKLKEFSTRYQADALWRSSKPDDHAWAKQMHSGPPTAEDILDSMRDVTDDLPFGKRSNYGDQIFGRIPESHLFSHALPGGLWDFEGRAYMTEGLNNWRVTPHQREQLEINEDVLTTLLSGMRLFKPPRATSQGYVTVADMPYQTRCADGHISDGTRNKDGTFCRHSGCDNPAVPVRFVSLCSNGHLEPFNWNSWVRHKNSCTSKNSFATENIRIAKKAGAGYTLGAWKVTCVGCKQTTSLKGVTVTSQERGRGCRAMRPWINWDTDYSACDQKLSNRRRNSSSVALPDGGKALLIHPNVNWYLARQIPQLLNMDNDKLDARFDMYFEDICDDGTLDGTVFDKRVSNPEAEPKFDKEAFYIELVNYRNRPDTARRDNIRELERRGLAHGQRKPVDDGKHYLCYTEYGGEVTCGGWWEEPDCPLNHLSRVERLTEVQYITGVQRMEALDTQPLAEFPTDEAPWNLGTYNYGEGVFLGVDPEWLQNQVDSLGHRSSYAGEAAKRHSISKEIDFDNPHVVAALPVLHTFSHLLIKEVCSESGYSLGSIGERLYLKGGENGIEYAGILLYTTGSSSDGTLGGLASQATRDKIERVVNQAIRRRGECSNDPICSDHVPTPEEPNGSACHACVLLPETCCELGNRALDRNWGA